MTIKRKILINVAYAAVVIGGVFAVWAIAAAATGSEFVVPSIGSTFVALGDVLGGAAFWRDLGGTLLRCLIGYVIAVALGFALFFLCTAYKRMRAVVEPLISALRSLPAVAITLVLILSVGVHGTPVVLAVLVIMPMMYSAARAKISVVPRELAETSVLLGANKLQTMRILWLPCLSSALPDILSSALSYNIKTVIGAEILAQTPLSLGMLMKLSQLNLQPARLIAYVIVAVALSVIVELVVKLALKRVFARFSD